jgi:hypothetical protein
VTARGSFATLDGPGYDERRITFSLRVVAATGQHRGVSRFADAASSMRVNRCRACGIGHSRSAARGQVVRGSLLNRGAGRRRSHARHRASWCSDHVGVRIEGRGSLARRRGPRRQSKQSGSIDVGGSFWRRCHHAFDTHGWLGVSGSARRPGGCQQLGIVAVSLSRAALRVTCHVEARAKFLCGDRSSARRGNPRNLWRTAECFHVSSHRV